LVVVLALPHPFPVDIHPEPHTVTGLTAEALGLRGKVLGLVGWNATLMDVNGHSFFKGLDFRDEDWVCYSGSAHELPSHSLLRSGSLMPSTISRFCASDIPAE
jgi:hypothetical protein